MTLVLADLYRCTCDSACLAIACSMSTPPLWRAPPAFDDASVVCEAASTVAAQAHCFVGATLAWSPLVLCARKCIACSAIAARDKNVTTQLDWSAFELPALVPGDVFALVSSGRDFGGNLTSAPPFGVAAAPTTSRMACDDVGCGFECATRSYVGGRCVHTIWSNDGDATSSHCVCLQAGRGAADWSRVAASLNADASLLSAATLGPGTCAASNQTDFVSFFLILLRVHERRSDDAGRRGGRRR